MTPPRTAETTVNPAFYEVLKAMHPRWREPDSGGVEQTKVLRGSPGSQPDLVISPSGSAPVVIECKIGKSGDVEQKAKSRLNQILEVNGRTIETALAVVYPQSLEHTSGAELASELRDTSNLKWVMWFLSPQNKAVRFPLSGWVEGSAADLAGVIESRGVSTQDVEKTADALHNAVNDVAKIGFSVATRTKIATALHQADNEQTMRMAAAMLINAFVFQIVIAEHHDEIPTVAEIRERGSNRGLLNQKDVLEVWDQILEINYLPVFAIASKVLISVPDVSASGVLETLAEAAQNLAPRGLATVQDLAGQAFGTLITDRKFLAAFFTLPASATLLAEIAVSRLATDWADGNDITSLRIADLACGTGALLSATYRRIAARARRDGLDDSKLHKAFMERTFIGCDVLPAAAHLTTTMLSSVHPLVGYEGSSIHVMPYGGIGDQLSLGSLELLTRDTYKTLHLFGKPGERLGAAKDDAERSDTAVDISDGTLDMVIMNPPFTRATGQEGDRSSEMSAPVPAFAGLDNNEEAQREMSNRLKTLSANSAVGQGNAGLASYFLALGDTKLKGGGVLAFVLPYTFVSGNAWKPAREMLASAYQDIIIVAIASHESTGRAFSADTHMAEVLVVATKKKTPQEKTSQESKSDQSADQVRWVSLRNRPTGVVEAGLTGQCITNACRQQNTQTELKVGDDLLGVVIEAGITQGGAAGVRSGDLAAVAAALTVGVLRFPLLDPVPIRVTELGKLGKRGPYHLDIRHYPRDDDNSKRAPFTVSNLDPESTPTIPVLWAHDVSSNRESSLVVEPDKAASVREGMDKAARDLWRATATRLHYNRDFQFTSQRLAACITPRKSLGGRAWPSWIVDDTNWEIPLALWANTTLGLVSFWWTGTRAQQGRSALTLTRLANLTTVDCSALDDQEIQTANAIFDEHSTKAFLPANQAWEDENRHNLDEAVLCDLLKLHLHANLGRREFLDSVRILRKQWCEEPSVHGGKTTHP